MPNAFSTSPTWQGVIDTGLPASGKRVCLRATSMSGEGYINQWPSNFNDTDLLRPEQLPARPWDREGVVILHQAFQPSEDASQTQRQYQDVGHLYFMLKQYCLALRISLDGVPGAVQGAALIIEATVNSGEFIASVFKTKPAPV